MAKINNKAFTLVELLAVIVILAIILVIAVPQIISTINESRKGALASSAKLIAGMAETAYMSNQTLGIEKALTCQDVSSYTEEDYTCNLEFVGDKAYVTLEGSGKFDGLYVCSGTTEDAEATEEACTGGSVETAVAKIEGLAVTGNTEGLIRDDTADTNIRYTGASPKNYIKFNEEDWRIIGIFNMTTASGSTEKLMKIVKDTSIGDMSWDSSKSNVGWGVNQWDASTYTSGNAYEGADLMRELNTLYLNKGSGTCYNNSDNASTTCDFTNTGIKDTYRGMIEEVVWNTGAITYASSASSKERSLAYTQERGTKTGKMCTSGIYCGDSVARTITWTGKVGLIYPSDYGYASTSGTDIRNRTISTTNWLNSGSSYWTLSPCAYSSHASLAWYVDFAFAGSGYASYDNGVRPAIYLKSDVSITSGDGASSATAYQISMN